MIKIKIERDLFINKINYDKCMIITQDYEPNVSKRSSSFNFLTKLKNPIGN